MKDASAIATEAIEMTVAALMLARLPLLVSKDLDPFWPIGLRRARTTWSSLASLALVATSLWDTSRTSFSTTPRRLLRDASLGAPLWVRSGSCEKEPVDAMKIVRVEVRLSPFVSRREEPTGGLGGLLLGRGELGDRPFHGCAAIEEVEVIDEPERFDSEDGRNFRVAEGQQVVAVALFAAEARFDDPQ